MQHYPFGLQLYLVDPVSEFLSLNYLLNYFFCYSLKNFASCSMRNCGCSSEIQCPESGTTLPRTSVASKRIESSAAVPKLHSPPRTKTGIGSLTVEYSLFCFISSNKAL